MPSGMLTRGLTEAELTQLAITQQDLWRAPKCLTLTYEGCIYCAAADLLEVEMEIRDIRYLALAAGLVGAMQVQAGYNDAAGDVWRSGQGMRAYLVLTPEMAIVGCDGKVAEQAAPAAMPAPKQPPAPVAMMALDTKVNFAFDRADLDATATAAIDALVQQAKSKGSIKSVRLTGHADRVGTEDYNMDLSLRRASAVGDYLRRTPAVPAQAIEISGRGESGTAGRL